MLKMGDIREFNIKKQFKYIKSLGSGGTGDTLLFEDETTKTLFAFKKYAPKDERFIDEYYRRFVDEIKILFNLSHKNIVRIYNYYLYPEHKIGYLQMEYIDGVSIDEFKINECNKLWSDIFKEVISAFEYLEKNGVLHRDIRPSNILIDRDGNVKIIDFGFGKKLQFQEENGKSVFLNWPVSEHPEEILLDKIYNHQTEIYYVGKLFQYLVEDSEEEFRFISIINKMIEKIPSKRYRSFTEISMAISAGALGEIDFTSYEKEVYIKFADVLESHINSYLLTFAPIKDINDIISRLEDLIKTSSLEEYIQDNSKLINCFISTGYNYSIRNNIEVSYVVDFYKLLIGLNSNKQKIVLDNIFTRLARIKVDDEFDDDIPF